MYCGQTVRPRTKVTTDSLWEVVYEKSIGTKMNDLDLCLEVVLRSCEPHSPLNISETVREAWFQRTTYGLREIKWHVTDDVT